MATTEDKILEQHVLLLLSELLWDESVDRLQVGLGLGQI